MKIATTTGDFSFYCNNDEDKIRELHRAGFRHIDLSMYSFSPDCAYMRDDWREPEPRHRSKGVTLLVILLALIILALVAFVVLARVAPDFVDSLLYTPDELRIINY